MPYERYPLISEHNLIPYHDAFSQTGEESAQTQSAVLLGIGALLSEQSAAFPMAAGAEEQSAVLPEEDLDALAFPRHLLQLQNRRGIRFQQSLLQPEIGQADFQALKGARDFHDSDAESKFIQNQVSLSETLARSSEPEIETAAKLVENSLNHPQPLVRVAAASVAHDLFPTREHADDVMEQILTGLDSEDGLVRDLSATVLARVDADHPRLAALTEGSDQGPPGETQHTSLLVHGTWARGNSWWQPGGDFHNYILNDVFTDLYSQADRYDWSGGWSDGARSLAATQLQSWAGSHNLNAPTLLCHSHGGSVAMEATHGTLQVNKLVLLSCPVHTQKYLPNFNQVNETVSVRVRFDLVILADGGGQRFRVNGIRENRLPVWFNHSASHDPAVWQDHDVPAKL